MLLFVNCSIDMYDQHKRSFGEEISHTVFSSIVDAICREGANMLAQKVNHSLLAIEVMNSIKKSTQTALIGVNSFKKLSLPESERDNIEMLIHVIKSAATRKKLGWSINALFVGPPGTGKTETMSYLVRLAIRISKKNRKKVFPIIIPGSKIRAYDSEIAVKVITQLLEKIEHKVREGYLVLFAIDEVDSLLYDNQTKRSDVLVAILSHMTILDNLRSNPKVKGNFILLCTTNVARVISSAMSRRFEFMVTMDITSPEQKVKIYKSQIRAAVKETGIPCNLPDKFLLEVAHIGFNMTGGEILNIVRIAWSRAQYVALKRKANPKVNIVIFFQAFIDEYYKRIIMVEKNDAYAVSEKKKLLQRLEELKTQLKIQSKTQSTTQSKIQSKTQSTTQSKIQSKTQSTTQSTTQSKIQSKTHRQHN